MKNIKFSRILLMLVAVLMVFSCSENDGDYPETRLFRPVLNSNLTAKDNSIIVDMAKMTKAVSYKIEISRDNFTTVLGHIDTPESTVKIVGLLWDTEYQIRATAISADPEFNSKVSDLGSVKTEKFPSILKTPTEFDVIDVAAKLTWAIGPLTGAPITQVKVFAIADETLSSPLFTFPVTSAEQLAGTKIVNGLTPSTQYQIAIYSEEVVRGWEKYTTKVGIVVDANTIDLRGITPTSTLLFDTLTAAAAGSTIILDGNVTYDLNASYLFNKSLTIKSGYSFGQGGAIVNLNSNFNILAGSNVGSVVFDGVILTSPDTAAVAKYVFNVNQSANIGEITFNNCKINNLRGVCRFQPNTTGTIGKYTINNCIINNIGGYGIFNVDGATWTAGDVLLKNSTIYRSTVFMASKSTSPTKSVTIEDCTLNEFVAKAGTMFKWVNEVTNGITIRNTIVGHGYDNTGGTDYSIIGYSGLATTTWIILNTYATSDFVYVPLKPTIPGFPSFTYPKKVENLWINPVSGDFNIKDPSFAGVKDSGDPRWRK